MGYAIITRDFRNKQRTIGDSTKLEYKMRLHENKELFRDAVLATSQLKGIPEIYIEKDFKTIIKG